LNKVDDVTRRLKEWQVQIDDNFCIKDYLEKFSRATEMVRKIKKILDKLEESKR